MKLVSQEGAMGAVEIGGCYLFFQLKDEGAV